MSLPIPGPPGWPLVGNIFDINPATTAISPLKDIAKKYGPIFSLNILGRVRYFVTNRELLDELCDEKRFMKAVDGGLMNLREGIGQGLFTADTENHDWEIAHRTLVPAFGPIGIKHMFDEMYDIASQMISKMAREGPDTAIDVPDMFTRLTLDSIALCAMDYRFNSFYKEELHPFVGAMVRFLMEGQARVRRTRIEQMLNPSYQRQFEADIALLRNIASDVVERRKENPVDKKDLLNAMLLGKDPKTGEKLSRDSVINNMITFLIAGHETTSGMLSFASYQLMKHPEAYRKAQAEVDSVVGTKPITFEHLSKLPYIEAVLRETLRLTPTAPGFFIKSKTGKEEIIGGGKYVLPADATAVVMLVECHRDPEVWGADAEDFNPEHCFGDNWNNLPPNSFKAFGNGVRGCIGRPFAWNEGILALAMVLQNFDIRLVDPSYELQVKRTLTIKPAGLFMKASLRRGIDPIYLEKRLFSAAPVNGHDNADLSRVATNGQLEGGKPFKIFYGGNSGTCESLAQSLAGSGKRYGFSPVVRPLDEAVQVLTEDGPSVIITASYEGQPPDNAAHFVEWLKTTKDSLKGVDFAVYGCGHHDWASTFQRIPRLVDDLLLEHGAKHIEGIERAECDVALGTIFDDFDAWQKKFWQALTGNAKSDTDVEIFDMSITTSSRARHLNHNVQDAIVLKNEVLTKPGVPEKRHMVIQLPTDMTYEAGDYMAVLPVNPTRTVSRVLRRFGLPWDATMTLKEGTHTTIPTEHELPISHVLSTYVELTLPATKKAITGITQFAASVEETEGLKETLSGDQTMSVLEILEKNPKVKVPFAAFLAMVPAMRIRQYSVSSSPLEDPTTASITFSIMKNPSLAGDEETAHLGVATHYLSSLAPSSSIQIAMKKSHTAFHLPTADKTTPIIMAAAGTGIAPFIGFIAERAAKIRAAEETGNKDAAKPAEAILFYGCRNPEEDYLHRSKLEDWERLGAVKVYTAFSRASEKSDGCKYAQDRLWAERETVAQLFKQGARCYICGSRKLGEGVAEIAKKIHIQRMKEKRGEDVSQEQADAWWSGLRNERYAVDVFD